MNITKPPKVSGAQLLAFALAIALGLLLFPYLPGLVGAGVVYVVALPVVRWMDPAGRSRVAPHIVMILVFVMLVLPGLALLAELIAQVPLAARTLQHSATVARLMSLEIGDLNVGALLRLASTEIIRWSSQQTITALTGAVNTTMNLIVALFGAYYLLVSGERLWAHTKAIAPIAEQTAELLRVRFHRVTEAMLIGVVLTCASQGALVGLAFAVLGLPQPVLWGAVTAVTSLLPIFGSALVWMPAVLVLALEQRITAAVMLALYGALLVSNIDNALRIAVYRRVSQVHPMVTLLGAFAGVRTFGIAGLLIGPLLLSYSLELFRLYRSETLLTLEPPHGVTPAA